MTFKNYLNEKNDSSRKIYSWMKQFRLPVTPKFFEETFGVQEEYCFKAVTPNRLSSVYKRQNKKNQTSTFVHFNDTNIFWGAGEMGWYNQNPDNATLVAILKGKVTIKGTTDLWSFAETAGRRWIDIKSILRYNTELTDVLGLVSKRLQKNYTKGIKNLELEQIQTHETKSGNIVYNNDEKSPERDRDLNKLITLYINLAYESFKYYKKDLLKSYRTDITKRAHYNEHLCYDYEVKRVIVLSEDPENTKEVYKLDYKEVEYTSDINYLKKELKKYQKLNQSL